MALRAPFHVLSLCSGIGGLDLGIRMALPFARTICFVEREAYCVSVLAARMADQALDEAPVWDDLATFRGGVWRRRVSLVAAGYPCQPFSVAGRRQGADDPRHLWPYVARIVRECEPEWCFFENVPGHLSLGFREVRDELQGMGFRVEAGLFSAAEVGAPHRRERLLILAHAEKQSQREPDHPPGSVAPERDFFQPGRDADRVADAFCSSRQRRRRAGHLAGPPGRVEGEAPEWERGRYATHGRCAPLADPAGIGNGPLPGSVHGNAAPDREEHVFEPGGGRSGRDWLFPPGPGDAAGWRECLGRDPALEPAICGDADGTAVRVDRLRALGNAVVPLVAAHALRALLARFGEH